MNAADQRKAQGLIADLRRFRGGVCGACGGELPGFDVLASSVLGFRDAPRCIPCLAKDLDRDGADLRAELARYMDERPCYGAALEFLRTGVEPAEG